MTNRPDGTRDSRSVTTPCDRITLPSELVGLENDSRTNRVAGIPHADGRMPVIRGAQLTRRAHTPRPRNQSVRVVSATRAIPNISVIDGKNVDARPAGSEGQARQRRVKCQARHAEVRSGQREDLRTVGDVPDRARPTVLWTRPALPETPRFRTPTEFRRG